MEFYERNKANFAREHPGRYLLIKEDRLIGSFATKDEALAQGYRRYLCGPFFIGLSGADTPFVSIPRLGLGTPMQS